MSSLCQVVGQPVADYMLVYLLFFSSYDQAEAHELQKTKGFECVDGLMADEAVALFQGFYENGNQNGKSGAVQF